MNIVLIGMRGAGKTVVGKILAEKMGRRFVDMDGLIVERAGMSIADIVRQEGWEGFRWREEAVAAELGEMENIVNAAGGGVVTREETVQALKKHGIMVWLQASTQVLLERIDEDSSRPLLVNGRTWPEDVDLTLVERQPLYQAAADISVDTENSSPEVVSESVVKLLTAREDIND